MYHLISDGEHPLFAQCVTNLKTIDEQKRCQESIVRVRLLVCSRDTYAAECCAIVAPRLDVEWYLAVRAILHVCKGNGTDGVPQGGPFWRAGVQCW